MQVIATAGHVDHGKSALVRALTGMEPDRWAEERRRGLTIDLGFAWTELPGGATVAFVDVPGHERFVTNMLAGVGPVPAALLVVAADEGWMPQSAEHLDALHALGVEHGLLVITRADRLDPELARHEAQAQLAGTSFDGVPAIGVSAVTGAGTAGPTAPASRGRGGRAPGPARGAGTPGVCRWSPGAPSERGPARCGATPPGAGPPGAGSCPPPPRRRCAGGAPLPLEPQNCPRWTV